MRPVQDWNRYVDRLGKAITKMPSREPFPCQPEPVVLPKGRGARRTETREELLRRLLDPTLNLEETACILEVCPTTVRRYTNRGVLPHERSAGNQRRFKLSCVLEFHEAQQRGKSCLDQTLDKDQ